MIGTTYEKCVWCFKRAKYGVKLHGNFCTFWCEEDMPLKGYKSNDKLEIKEL